MRRFILLLVGAVMSVSVIGGCSDKKKEKSESEISATEPVTQPQTQEPSAEIFAQSLEPAQGVYIYDNAKVLSQEDFNTCNNYAEWLCEKYLINAAVVTTQSLGEQTPAEYAQSSYNDLFASGGDGLLILINNDTNEDYIYKTGSCLSQISETDEAAALYTATAEIVAGDYKSAILRLLSLGETSQYVFDDAGVFLDEHFTDLEALCSQTALNCSVVATGSTGTITSEELCRSYYDRKFKDGNGVLIMLDTSVPKITVVSDGVLPDNLNTIIAEAESCFETDGYHSGGYHSAVRYIITQLEGA